MGRMRVFGFGILVVMGLWLMGSGASGATFYVDSVSGSDGNPGTSPKLAWKSLERVNKETFAPGSRVLFKAGTGYDGTLRPLGSGDPRRQNLIGVYGRGAKPRIRAGSPDPGVLLENTQYWDVTGLDISGGIIGVSIRLLDYGPARNLRLRNLTIHDIQGGTTGDNGGILCVNSGESTIFDGLLIEGCDIQRVDRNGILITDYPNPSNKHRSVGVVIRKNKLSNIGGDGIFILACKGALIERNGVRYAHQRVGRAPGERACAGIWPHRCDNTLVQFNEVSHTAVGGLTIWDSQAFDDDISCAGTIFQYNYSHDNAGGFLLVCGGHGTVARYNISQNDATATFTFEADGVHDVSIYNNTVYVREGMEVQLVRNTFGTPKRIRFTNNIFDVRGQARFAFWNMRDVSFDNNVFFGKFSDMPVDFGAIYSDPMLVRPGSGGEGFGSLGGYRLKEGSPCPGAGAFDTAGRMRLFEHD